MADQPEAYEPVEAEPAEPMAADAEPGRWKAEPAAAEVAEPAAAEVAEPAEEPVVPAMSFGEPVAAAPFIVFAAAHTETEAVEAETVAEMAAEAEAVEAETVAEPEVVEVETVVAEAVNDEVELVAAEAEAAEVEAVADEVEPVLAEAEAVEVEAVEPEADAEAVPSLAMGERPLELVAADGEEYVEPEPEAPWDWQEIPGCRARCSRRRNGRRAVGRAGRS